MSADEDGVPAEDSSEESDLDRTAEYHSVASDPVVVEYARFDCTTDDAGALAVAAEAARVAVEHGQCIVLPTDTVYGIGADAFSAEAVQRLLDAKVRGRDMPPPVLIADAGLMRVLAIEVPSEARDLVAKHWPGPLTVIVKAQPSLRLDLGEAEGTIALRVPDHDLAREVLRRTGPMAVSSANISGLSAAVTIDEAIQQLGDNVSVYLDGGRLGAADSAPSTIVDFSKHDTGEVLRHGALSVALLRETLAELADLVEGDDESPSEESVAAEADSSESDLSQSDDSQSDDSRSDDTGDDPARGVDDGSIDSGQADPLDDGPADPFDDGPADPFDDDEPGATAEGSGSHAYVEGDDTNPHAVPDLDDPPRPSSGV